MDQNKRLKLVEVGYRINPSCGTCSFGSFARTLDFGECRRHLYEHAKHVGPPRFLSVHRAGSCTSFKQGSMIRLGAYVEFAETPTS